MFQLQLHLSAPWLPLGPRATVPSIPPATRCLLLMAEDLPRGCTELPSGLRLSESLHTGQFCYRKGRS